MYRLQVWLYPCSFFSPPVNMLLVSRHNTYRVECTFMHHVCTSLNVCVLLLTWLTQGLLCLESAFGHFPINQAGIRFIGSLERCQDLSCDTNFLLAHSTTCTKSKHLVGTWRTSFPQADRKARRRNSGGRSSLVTSPLPYEIRVEVLIAGS